MPRMPSPADDNETYNGRPYVYRARVRKDVHQETNGWHLVNPLQVIVGGLFMLRTIWRVLRTKLLEPEGSEIRCPNKRLQEFKPRRSFLYRIAAVISSASENVRPFRLIKRPLAPSKPIGNVG